MRRTASDAVAFQRQRVPNIGASSSACTSSSRARRGLEVVAHLVERKAVRRPERQHDAVFERAGLQLEVELAAHALAQRQAPGLVDARAVRRVDHQVACRRPRRRSARTRCAARSAARRARPSTRRGTARAAVRRRRAAAARSRNQRSQASTPSSSCASACALRRDTAWLSSSVRPRLSPSQNGIDRRLAPGVLDHHLAGLDLDDAVRRIAELEHVAGQALEREVLVQRADAVFLGQQHHVVVELVGDHAGVGHGGQPRATACAQHAVDRVVGAGRRRAGHAAWRIHRPASAPPARIRRASARGTGRRGAAARTARRAATRGTPPRRSPAAPARPAACRARGCGRARRAAPHRAARRIPAGRRARAGTGVPSGSRRSRGRRGPRAAGRR